MYNTLEILREMFEIGMIDKAEYAAMVCEYRNHVRAIQEMDLAAEKAKETIDSIKSQEEKKQEEPDPKYQQLWNAYLNGIVSKEYFRMKTRNERRIKRKEKFGDSSTFRGTSAEYHNYVCGRLKK